MEPKKLLYILALITLTQANLNAQWTNIYTNNNIGLVAIDCINEDTVYAAAYNTYILRTFNKGQTWQTIDPGFEIYAKDINFPDARTGYIVGASGRIAKTTDYGDNWELLIADTNYRHEKVEFVNPDTGWIIANDMISGYWGGSILRTFDGGESWDYHYIDDYELHDIEMINNLKGFIGINSWSSSDDYGFLKTEDGGDTWNLSNPGMEFVTSISFINANIGYCLGMLGPEGGNFKTVDGGEIWAFTQGGVGGNSVNRLQFINEQTGFYAGWEAMFNDGEIFRTDDGGNTWSEQITGTFRDIDMINIDTGYAVTDYSRIYKTINGGLPVGITEPSFGPSNFITISPNPLTEKLVVKIDPVMINRYGKLTFLLYDQFGRKLKIIKNITKSEFEISCEAFLPGIYFISISGDNRIIESVKIIIK